MTRVYWNSATEAPNVWSVDDGPGTPERNVARVVFDTEDDFPRRDVARTRTDLKADNKNSPKGWIEIEGNVVDFKQTPEGTVAIVYL